MHWKMLPTPVIPKLLLWQAHCHHEPTATPAAAHRDPRGGAQPLCSHCASSGCREADLGTARAAPRICILMVMQLQREPLKDAQPRQFKGVVSTT